MQRRDQTDVEILAQRLAIEQTGNLAELNRFSRWLDSELTEQEKINLEGTGQMPERLIGMGPDGLVGLPEPLPLN